LIYAVVLLPKYILSTWLLCPIRADQTPGHVIDLAMTWLFIIIEGDLVILFVETPKHAKSEQV
jgi:hypothetical protein